MHRSKASDITVEYVGRKTVRSGDPAIAFRKEAMPVLRKALAAAELDTCPRRVLVTSMFTKSPGRIPEWSGILPADQGVRFRIQARASNNGFLGILLCCDEETPASLLESLAGGLRDDDLAPSDPAIVEAAVAMSASLAKVPSLSLDAFAGLVAAKAGSQSKQYWMDALCEAERLGFLWRDGRRFNVPSGPESEPESVPPQGKLVIEPVSGNELDAGVIPLSELAGDAGRSSFRPGRTPVGVAVLAHLAVEEVMASQPKPAKAVDPDELMEDDADKLFEVLSLLKTLNAERKAKRERRKELADSLAVVDASLAGLDKQIRDAKTRLDADALLRLAEAADTSKGTA